jgi:hypothetical protein
MDNMPANNSQQTFVLDGPSLTSREAETLFIHYLEMAGCLFELLPDGFEIPSDRYSDAVQEAATSFFIILNRAYTAMGADMDDISDPSNTPV